MSEEVTETASGGSDESREATATETGRTGTADRPSGLPGPAPDARPHPDRRRNTDGVRIDPAAEAAHEPRHAVISALVDHEPGVLARVSGLVSRRQFNIESLTVGPTTVDGHARITMVVEETDPGIDQVRKQLAKLPAVISVGEIAGDAVAIELALLKVRGDEPERVHAMTEMYDGETVDAGPRTITVRLTGDEARIDDAVDAFRRFGIVELARTGPTALARGATPTTPGEEPAPNGATAGANGLEDAGGDRQGTASDETTDRTTRPDGTGRSQTE